MVLRPSQGSTQLRLRRSVFERRFEGEKINYAGDYACKNYSSINGHGEISLSVPLLCLFLHK